MKLLCCVIVILAILSSANGQLTIEENGDSYQIYYRDILLVDHTTDDPVLSIGEGTAVFEESTGNFNISDDALMMPLPNMTLVSSTSRNGVFDLTSSVNPGVTVTLTITVATSLNQEFLSMVVTSVTPEDSEYNRLSLRLAATEDEKVFGGGEQYTYFNLRGYNFPIWSREQGVGRDGGVIAAGADADGNAGGSYDTTYWPQASFMSDKIYSLTISNYDYLEMNFEDSLFHEIYIHSLALDIKLYRADSILELVPLVANQIGLQKNLPDWILSGTILGVQRGTDEMMAYYQLAKDAGVNISAMWIQDWSGKIDTDFGYRVYWNWKWNETFYPDLDQKIIELGNEGVKVGVYCNPHLIVDSDMYIEAESLGYLMTDSNGKAFQQDFRGFYGGTVDLMNSDAANWYKESLTANIVDLGIALWMADFGEYTRTDMFSKDTSLTPQEIHNKLPVTWAELNENIVADSKTEDSSVYFMRSGAFESSRHQILAWAGDQNVDFSIADGVASTIVAALSLSVSGMGVTHFDIGGYTTIRIVATRSEELFLRSAEYAVFTPVMRTHEGNLPELNFQFYTSEEGLASFARLTQIHSLLFPYTRSIVDENSISGMPVQRPMFLHYESDPAAWDLSYQYMYGPDLIVAPVISSNQDDVTLYIPEGAGEEWYHLFTGEGPYVGPMTLSVFSPIGSPAVLYRADSPYRDIFEEITNTYGVAENLSEK